jgi:hypothetical protein
MAGLGGLSKPDLVLRSYNSALARCLQKYQNELPRILFPLPFSHADCISPQWRRHVSFQICTRHQTSNIQYCQAAVAKFLTANCISNQLKLSPYRIRKDYVNDTLPRGKKKPLKLEIVRIQARTKHQTSDSTSQATVAKFISSQ